MHVLCIFIVFITANTCTINLLKPAVYVMHQQVQPFKDKAQIALFKDPVRTAK